VASSRYSEAPIVVLHALEVSSVSLVSFYGGDSWCPQDILKPPYVVLCRLARRGGVKRISGLVHKNLLRLWKESDLRGLLSSLKEIRGVLKIFQRPVCRLTRRRGIKRISGLIYETRGVLKIFLEARGTIPICLPRCQV
jgi:hypothetical protein